VKKLSTGEGLLYPHRQIKHVETRQKPRKICMCYCADRFVSMCFWMSRRDAVRTAASAQYHPPDESRLGQHECDMSYEWKYVPTHASSTNELALLSLLAAARLTKLLFLTMFTGDSISRCDLSRHMSRSGSIEEKGSKMVFYFAPNPGILSHFTR
jgi:hypothetical protein